MTLPRRTARSRRGRGYSSHKLFYWTYFQYFLHLGWLWVSADLTKSLRGPVVSDDRRNVLHYVARRSKNTVVHPEDIVTYCCNVSIVYKRQYDRTFGWHIARAAGRPTSQRFGTAALLCRRKTHRASCRPQLTSLGTKKLVQRIPINVWSGHDAEQFAPGFAIDASLASASRAIRLPMLCARTKI